MTTTPTKVNTRAGEQLVQPISLSLITTSHNPRWPVRNLQENLEGEGFGEYTSNPLGLVHDLALSDDPEKQAEFVRLCETYEGEARQVVELANSRRKHAIQPISLRRFRVKDRAATEAAREVAGANGVGKNVYTHRYGLIAGERRLLAAAYNHAKHGDPAQIGATAVEITVDAAEDLAFDENMQRQDMQPLEVADWIRHKYEQKRETVKDANKRRPVNKEKYDLKVFAEERGLDYQYTRSRYDLTFLPEPLKKQVRNRTLGITEGAKVGRDIKNGKRLSDGTSKVDAAEINGYKNERQRSRTLKELQAHFDEVRDDQPKDYLRALAFAMNQTFRDADRESKARIKADFQSAEEAA